MELHDLSATELGERIAAREVSPVEVAEHLLDRIDRLDDRLHAFVATTPDRALAEARRAEREIAAGNVRSPLHGVPYAAKDLFDVAGEATGAGTSLRAGHRAPADARTIELATRAGMVLLGKTHTVQFAYGGVGVNHDTGTPHNPHFDEPHVPGGSSSGSAVAVAAGMVPLALGTDTGGSVRAPAALCGIVGLKTTVGRISRAGVYPLSQTLDSVGPLARSVADAAAFHDVLQGADPADPSTVDVPSEPVGTRWAEGLGGLRIVVGEGLCFDGVDAEIDTAVRDVVAGLRGARVRVESIDFVDAADVTDGEPGRLMGMLLAAEACAINRTYLDDHLDQLDPVVSLRMLRGRELSAVDYLRAHDEMAAARRRFAERLAHVDAIVVPTTMRPSLPVAEVDATPERYAQGNVDYLRNTAVGNRLGLCGVSVPCGTTADGAPIGLMVHAHPFREDIALRVAAAVIAEQRAAPRPTEPRPTE